MFSVSFGGQQGGRSCAGAPAEKFGLGENFKPEHTVFCRELRFDAIYAKKAPIWIKNSVSWARTITWHILHILLS